MTEEEIEHLIDEALIAWVNGFPLEAGRKLREAERAVEKWIDNAREFSR